MADHDDSADQIGRQLVPVDVKVTRELLERYEHATGHPDIGSSRAPSVLASVYTYGIIAQFAALRGALLVGQRFDFLRAPRIGDRLRTTAVIDAMYVKRGRRYMELDLHTVDQHGDVVSHGRLTRVVPPGDAGA